MTILEDENIILEDVSFIIDKIKEWIACNVNNIYIYKNVHSYGSTLKRDVKSIYEDFSDQWVNGGMFKFGSQQDFLKKRTEYINNINDEEFSKFVQINVDSCPARIIINGDISMNSYCGCIPADLFVIEKIKGDLDISYCSFKSTDGFPDRENIVGNINMYGNTIKDNKFLINL